MTKTTTLGTLFTDDQIEAALTLWNEDRPNFHARVLKEVVEPAMPTINAKTGQENYAPFMAYMIEAVFMKASEDE